MSHPRPTLRCCRFLPVSLAAFAAQPATAEDPLDLRRAWQPSAQSELHCAAAPASRRRVLALAAALLAVAEPSAALAQAGLQASEYQVKAAFICKFASYVEWPAGERADQPFVIGVLGGDDVVLELTRAATGLAVQGRPMTVRRIGRNDPLTGLHILFIARSHAARQPELLAGARGLPMLTVTEVDPPSAGGSIINFVLVDDKVRFDITLPLAEQGNLKISARLLGVARKVWTKSS